MALRLGENAALCSGRVTGAQQVNESFSPRYRVAIVLATAPGLWPAWGSWFDRPEEVLVAFDQGRSHIQQGFVCLFVCLYR